MKPCPLPKTLAAVIVCAHGVKGCRYDNAIMFFTVVVSTQGITAPWPAGAKICRGIAQPVRTPSRVRRSLAYPKIGRFPASTRFAKAKLLGGERPLSLAVASV